MKSIYIWPLFQANPENPYEFYPLPEGEVLYERDDVEVKNTRAQINLLTRGKSFIVNYSKLKP